MVDESHRLEAQAVSGLAVIEIEDGHAPGRVIVERTHRGGKSDAERDSEYPAQQQNERQAQSVLPGQLQPPVGRRST